MDNCNNRSLPYLLSLSLLVVLSAACNNGTQESAPSQATATSSTPQSLTEDPSLSAWANLISGTIDDFSEVYVGKPVFLGPSGSLGFQMEEQIQRHRALYRNLTSLKTKQQIVAREEQGLHYEIGSFTTAQGEEFKHLLILKQEGDTLRREMEFITKAAVVDSTVIEAFDQRRAEWIQLCNAHNAEKLVTSLYTPHALYYNHKPLIIGHEAIAADYQYMNRAEYSLQLSPIIVELVNNSIAFEIGQCSGSYGGKYIFVWQKDRRGKWWVMLDSNI